MSNIKHEQLEFLRIFRYAKEKGLIKRKRKTPMEARSSNEAYFRLIYDVLKLITIDKNLFNSISRNGYYITFYFIIEVTIALEKLSTMHIYQKKSSKFYNEMSKLFSNYTSLQQELRDINGNLCSTQFYISNLNYFKFKLLIEFIDKLENFCNASLELSKRIEKEEEIEKQNKLNEIKEINQKHNIVVPEAETEAQRKFNLALAKYLENSNGLR